MDGTLFDTEKIYHAAWNRAGIPDELYRQFIGRDTAHIHALIHENTRLDPAQVQAARNTYVEEELTRGIPLKPGLIPTLQWLQKNGYHSCIATSSPEITARRYLQQTETACYFDEIVSGNTLPHGKPAPDIYLLAAERMHVPAGACVVVEDSYNGVRSGAAAGMKTVMIPDEIGPDAEMQEIAAVILGSLSELPAYLTQLNRR